MANLYYTPKRPAVRFANSGSAMQSVHAMQVEPLLQYVSDHATRLPHFGGVLRFRRDFRDDLFSYRFPPFPADANPNTAPPAVPTSVALTGSNFLSGARVLIDDAGVVMEATSSFVDINRITFISPLPADQTERAVTVTIVNPGGMSASNPTIFAFENNPILLDISSSLSTASYAPSSSFIQGEVELGLDGFYFKRDSVIRVWSGTFTTVSTEVVWNSSSSLSALTPSVPSTGSYTLVVRSPSGLESNGLPINYVYHYPILGSVVPATCSTDGGDTIYLYGAYFLSGAVANLGGVDMPTRWSSTAMLTFSSPARGPGVVDVYVSNSDGQVSNTLTLKYVAGLPTVYTITPAGGGSGSLFQVTGKYLSSSDGTQLVTSMWLQSSSLSGATIPVPQFNVVNSGSASFVFPSATVGDYILFASSSAGVGFNLAAPVSYYLTPVISSIVPASGGVAGGYYIDVYGANFLAPTGTVWTVAGASASAVYVNSSYYRVLMPAHAAGAVTVGCTNLGRFSTSASFTYVSSSDLLSSGIWVPSI